MMEPNFNGMHQNYVPVQRLAPTVINEALETGDASDSKSMEGEEHIVGLDYILTAIVLACVPGGHCKLLFSIHMHAVVGV